IHLAGGDLGQKECLLFLGAEAQQIGAALAIRDPVGADRRAGGEHLLDHHVALVGGALLAAVLLRPGHAEPAALGHLAAELGAPAVRHRAHQRLVLVEEIAHLATQLVRGVGKFRRVETERLEAHRGRSPSARPSIAPASRPVQRGALDFRRGCDWIGAWTSSNSPARKWPTATSAPSRHFRTTSGTRWPRPGCSASASTRRWAALAAATRILPARRRH